MPHRGAIERMSRGPLIGNGSKNSKNYLSTEDVILMIVTKDPGLQFSFFGNYVSHNGLP